MNRKFIKIVVETIKTREENLCKMVVKKIIIARGQIIYLGKGIGAGVRLYSARRWN
jgi:hypothetical protein